MSTRTHRGAAAIALLALLGGVAGGAQAEQVQARVISSAPVTEANGTIRYDVTYEYAGRQYNTRVSNPPGASIWIDSSEYALAPPAAAGSQPQWAAAPAEAQGQQQPSQQQQQAWSNVVPEPGVVVSGAGAVYGQPAPVYAPAPVYVQPAPVYYPAPAYYAAPAYAYPPIGISLGFGYYHGGGRRWR